MIHRRADLTRPRQVNLLSDRSCQDALHQDAPCGSLLLNASNILQYAFNQSQFFCIICTQELLPFFFHSTMKLIMDANRRFALSGQ